MIIKFNLEKKKWHPSEKKNKNLRVGTETWQPHANVDTTSNSLDQVKKKKKIWAGAASLTVASQQPLSTETKGCFPVSFPRLPHPKGKQYRARRMLWTAGREDESNGTLCRSQAMSGTTQVRGNCCRETAAENNEGWKPLQPLVL